MSRYPNPLPHLRAEAARQLVANPMLAAAPRGPARAEPSGWTMSCHDSGDTLICKPLGNGVLECKCHACVEPGEEACAKWISYQPSLDPEEPSLPGAPSGFTARPPKPQEIKLSCKKGKLLCVPFTGDDGEPTIGCICAKVDKDGNPTEITGTPTVQPARPVAPGALTAAPSVPAHDGCKACQMCGGTCIWDPFDNKLTCPGASAKCLASAMDLVQATKPKQPYRPPGRPSRRAISARAGIYRRAR